MPWTIDYLQDEAIVRVKTSGTIDIAGLKAMIVDLMAEGRRLGVDRFLVDHRDMTPHLAISDLYFLASEQCELGVTRQQKVALLWRPTAEQRSVMEFYANRAYNTGFTHRIFTNEQGALAWLLEEADGSEPDNS